MRRASLSRRARFAVLAVAAAAGCGDDWPGIGRDAGGESPPPQYDARRTDVHPGADAGVAVDASDGPLYQVDAGPCSLGWLDGGDPAPSHSALVAYDLQLQWNPSLQANSPTELFVDADGVAVFGSDHFIRATLDGDFVHDTEYPPRPEDGQRLDLRRVVARDGGYAATIAYYNSSGIPDERFCLVGQDGTIDLADCTPVAFPRWLLWDGAKFWLYGVGDQSTTYLAWLDSAGQATATYRFPNTVLGVANVHLLGDNVVACSDRPRENTCPTWFIDTYPRTIDMTQQVQTELMPADFKFDGLIATASSGQRAVWVYQGKCWQRPFWDPPGQPGCTSNWPPDPVYAAFRTIVDEAGQPVVLDERYPGVGLQMVWDGTQFVDVGSDWQSGMGTAIVPVLYAFDEDGITTVSHARPNLHYAYPPHRLGSWRLAVIAPNEYVVVYNMTDSNYTYIARFRVVPL
ncbi:MAG: hypothetical protein HY906_24225 [Deltaproteobacteria bacterium]|nr:hypothetical protein [Deltaproteobacteria bacterium]